MNNNIFDCFAPRTPMISLECVHHHFISFDFDQLKTRQSAHWYGQWPLMMMTRIQNELKMSEPIVLLDQMLHTTIHENSRFQACRKGKMDGIHFRRNTVKMCKNHKQTIVYIWNNKQQILRQQKITNTDGTQYVCADYWRQTNFKAEWVEKKKAARQHKNYYLNNNSERTMQTMNEHNNKRFKIKEWQKRSNHNNNTNKIIIIANETRFSIL